MANPSGPVRLQLSEAAEAAMKKRHISEDDLRFVIQTAEATGKKLCSAQQDRYLAKARAGLVTFYAEYSRLPDGYLVHTAYSHRSQLIEG